LNDGPGIRQTIFFKGCPLKCLWCHNPESRTRKIESFQESISCDGKQFIENKEIGRRIESAELLELVKKDKVFYDHSNGGVSFSGGEPLLQDDFLLEILKLVKAEDIHTAVDTSGYVHRSKFKKILKFTDLFLYDLKHMDDELHKKYTGVSNKKILENLVFLNEHKKKIYIRYPLIPGYNDDRENLLSLRKFIGRLTYVEQINILSYHKTGFHKYKKYNLKSDEFKVIEPTNTYVLKIKKFLEEEGMKVVIGG